MPRRTAVVIDSTAYLPAAQAYERDIAVVSLQVVVGDKSYDDGTFDLELLVSALRSKTRVTTSRPAPAIFRQEYEKAAANGAEAVVSIHLSSEVSGTYESAVLGAEGSPIPVEVVDSRTIGMGLGFAAITAAEVANRGGSLAEVVAAARRRAAATSVLFYVDTLEHLRRGGRVGLAQALVGSALSVKPLLHVVDGRIELLEKVRTAGRAVARIEDVAVDRATVAYGAVDIVVHHLGAAERADEVAQRLRDRIPDARSVTVSEVGAVIGAHAGPGLVGVVVAPE